MQKSLKNRILGCSGGGLGAMLAPGTDFQYFSSILVRCLGWSRWLIPIPCYTIEHFGFFTGFSDKKPEVLDSVAGHKDGPCGPGSLDPLALGPPSWEPKLTKNLLKKRSQTQQVFRSLFFWSILEASWGRFGRIWGAKVMRKLVQNRSHEGSWSKCKYLQNHQQGQCF